MSTTAATPATSAPSAATATGGDALVTGEAVLLDLRPASFATRLLSYLIDGAVMLAIQIGGVILTALVAAGLDLDDGFVAAGAVLSAVAAFVAYPVLTEMLTGGRSLGRLVMGTRVVRMDGGPVHARLSLLRALMAMLEIWGTSGAIALVTAVIDRRSRRLGDMLAGTFVVQERLRVRSGPRYQVPPPLQEWVRVADVGRLPLEVLQDIRSFLPRAGQLNPDSRRTIAHELVYRVMPSVAPAPPPGTDPELFLQAVLAERSRRDEQHLREADERARTLAEEVTRRPFGS
jgi:uncharacterized RDD family membrane protein YckC